MIGNLCTNFKLVASVFFDTNILVYSVDEADPQKREIALSLIAKHAIAKDAAISAQVLQEFYVASTRRLGINPIEARQLVKDFQMFELVQVTPGIIDEAIDRSILDQISFWDGLILSAAKLSRCEKLYSEDMNHGQAFGQARLVEPSGEGFYWFALGAVLIGGIIVVGVAKRHAADEFFGVRDIEDTPNNIRILRQRRLCAGFEAVSPGGQHHVLDEHAAVDP